MTRKDYEVVAKLVGHALTYDASNSDQKEGIKILARSLAEHFALENPRFDSGRFWDAVEHNTWL